MFKEISDESFISEEIIKGIQAKNDLPLGILINNSNEVRLIADGILQLPATLV
jgi:hypothetical protein